MATANHAGSDPAEHKEAFTIIQLSDSHLRKEEEGELLGMNTLQSLDAVIALARQEFPNPDLVLASGDISQDGSVEAYRRFQERASVFNASLYWFPGNHDDRKAMAEAAKSQALFEKVVQVPGWQLIFLDSLVSGKVHGELAESELAVLDKALSEGPKIPTMISFHHHPVDIGSRWLDTIGLKNRDDLFAITDRYEHVKVILWGHIHQERDEMRNGVRLLATPSTCVQFLPKSEDFAVDTAAPGYRWLKLHRNGTIDTGVSRADHIEFKVDYSSKGY